MHVIDCDAHVEERVVFDGGQVRYVRPPQCVVQFVYKIHSYVKVNPRQRVAAIVCCPQVTDNEKN